MIARISLRRRARDDLVANAAWLNDQSPRVGDRFIEAAFDTFDFLAGAPRIGRPESSRHKTLARLRSWPTRGFEN